MVLPFLTLPLPVPIVALKETLRDVVDYFDMNVNTAPPHFNGILGPLLWMCSIFFRHDV